MKKFICLLMYAILPMIANAYDVKIDGIYYNLDITHNTAKVTRQVEDYAGSYWGDIVIPSSFTYNLITYTVTGIDYRAFYKCNVTSVSIPNTVTSIDVGAFCKCSSLTTLTIPNSVKYIGDGAFDDTPFYNNMSNGVIYLGSCLYKYKGTMPQNTHITINDYTKGIGGGAFRNCSGLISLTIPNSMTLIGEEAFSGCSSLKEVTCYALTPPETTNLTFNGIDLSKITLYVPFKSKSLYSVDPWKSFGTISTIEKEVNGIFYTLDKTTKKATVEGVESASGSLNIPASISYQNNRYNVVAIGKEAFKDCTGLTSVNIPNSATSIGPEAFYGCSGLTSVNIPNSVTSIGYSAFEGCSGMTSVTIPNSVTSIDGDAFYGCSGLTAVQISDLAAWCNISFANLKHYGQANPLLNAHHLYLNGQEVKDLVIPNSVTSIGKYAFAGCSDLTSVTIHNSVTSIGSAAFWDCSGLTSVNIPESVTSIGSSAFSGCSGLTSVTIPNSVPSIGSSAFEGCSGLTSVTIPNSVTSIGESAFEGCNGLTSVTIGYRVTSIGGWAFSGCSGLTEVSCLAKNVPETGTDVFKNITLSNVTLSVPYESISNYKKVSPWSLFGTISTVSPHIDGVYYSLDPWKSEATVVGTIKNAYPSSVEIPAIVNFFGDEYRVTSIGESAFEGCSGLTSVNIPNSVTSIGDGAFDSCSGLTSVHIGNSVTSIGESAFEGCSGLTSVNIPNSVTSIGDGAFDSCSGLTSVHISDLEAWCSISFNRYDSNPLYYAHHLYLNGTEVTDLVIPNGVTSIGDRAFYKCSGLTSVNIHESVTSIGNYAFYGCSGLTSVTINSDAIVSANRTKNDNLNSIFGSQVKEYVVGDDVTAIGDYAFQGNTNLSMITLGNSVTSIGASAFYNCSGLTSVNIPNSVTSIGENAFYGCSGLTSVKVESGNTVYDSRNNCNAIIETASGKLIQGCMSTVIPNDVNAIGNYAFYGCSGLTSVNIHESVTSIGDQAFYGCTGLTSVSINSDAIVSKNHNLNSIFGSQVKEYVVGDDVTAIGDYAFQRNTNLSMITLGNSVTSIGDYAFRDCSGLTSVTIPNSVTSIGDYAFSGCSGLTSVHISDLAAWCNISFSSYDSNPLYYAHHLYLNGTEVTDLVIPNSVTSIGDYAFYKCSGLTSVTIPNSVTSIGDNAFSHCYGLTSVTIPNSVTSIGNKAFSVCSGLTSVTINSNDIVSADRTEKVNLNSIFGSQVKEYVVGDDVTAIGDYAFQGNTNLSMITLGNSVTSIGDYAFSGCSGLTSVHISDLEAWCNISFGNAYANPCFYAHHLYLNGIEVSDLVIPDGVKSIRFAAFYGCSGLTSVNIPNSVTSIGKSAFNKCSGLTSVNINSNDIVSADRTKNDNLNNIFGNQVKEYIVGEDVTAIGQNAFRGNTNLTTVSVGKNIGSIGDNAFYGCCNLATFTCYAADIPTANSTVFEGIDLTTATLYVPASALEDYEATKPWRRFGTILPIGTIPTAIDTADMEAGDYDKQYYDLSGRRVTSSQRGLLIVRDRSGKTRKVMVK